MAIWDDAAAIRDRLLKAGVRAVTDPRRVDPPCVLVVPTAGEFNPMCVGDADTDWSLHCLGPNPGGEDALRVLSQLVSRVVAEIPEVRDVRMGSYRVDTGDPWPSMDISLRTVSSWA